MINSRKVRWVGHAARVGEMKNAYIILAGNPEGKRPFGKSRCGREVNIRMDLRKVGWKGVDWMHMAEDKDQWRALVNTVMNFWIP
jgi:hypothetical protein